MNNNIPNRAQQLREEPDQPFLRRIVMEELREFYYNSCDTRADILRPLDEDIYHSPDTTLVKKFAVV